MMKKLLLASICALSLVSNGGEVGKPVERLAMPLVQGGHLVCIWDQSESKWLRDFETYNHSGVLEFQVPEWGRWYWVGLWDESRSEYVYSKWIGHFPTD